MGWEAYTAGPAMHPGILLKVMETPQVANHPLRQVPVGPMPIEFISRWREPTEVISVSGKLAVFKVTKDNTCWEMQQVPPSHPGAQALSSGMFVHQFWQITRQVECPAADDGGTVSP